MSDKNLQPRRIIYILMIACGVALFPMIAVQHNNYTEALRRHEVQQACYKSSSWATRWMCG